MKSDVQLSPVPSPASREKGQPPYRNFLIIVPDRCEATGGQVKSLARHLNQYGFAYVATPAQQEVEDDCYGVRHLPLGQDLPSFGSMSVVVVLDDRTWALRAVANYPEAEVFLLQCPQGMAKQSHLV
jgi:hypothetical protein